MSPARKKSKAGPKFILDLDRRVKELTKSRNTADKAIATGRKRLAAAKKKDDQVAIRENRRQLEGAIGARAAIDHAIALLNGCDCLDQFLNCDPQYL